MIDLWKVWKDDTQQPLDSVLGWWVGTKKNCIWIEHKSVADAICNQYHNSLAQVAPLVDRLEEIHELATMGCTKHDNQHHVCNCMCQQIAALTGTKEKA